MAAIVSSMPTPAGGCQLMPLSAQKAMEASMVERQMVARLSGAVMPAGAEAVMAASISGVSPEAQSAGKPVAARAVNGSGKSTHGGCCGGSGGNGGGRGWLSGQHVYW